MSNETRFWTVLGLLVAVFSAWVGYKQWILASTPPGQYVRTATNVNPDDRSNVSASTPSKGGAPHAPSVDLEQTQAPVATDFDNLTAPQTAPFTLQAALPTKIDIFSCEDDQLEHKRLLAESLSTELREVTASRIRVRRLATRVNHTSSYSIYDNIVRYDPDEIQAAKELARFATYKTGQAFSAAPALPGSPSEDYLSVFVCR